MRFKPVFIALAAVLITALATGSVATATPGGPTGKAPAPVAPPVVGVLDGPATVTQDGVKLVIPADSTVRSFELRYPAKSYSGWHKHWGIVVATVKSGTVKRQSGCTVTTFRAGDSFTEVGAHYVYNNKSEDAILEITQIYPASHPETRIEASAPECQYIKYR